MARDNIESLCWSCDRCRPLPDPEGCQKVSYNKYDGIMPEIIYSERILKGDKTKGQPPEIKFKKVIKCSNYTMSAEKKEEIRLLQVRKDRKRIYQR